MTAPLTTTKSALREQIRARLKGSSPAERAAASAQACVRLQQQEIWWRARAILFYAPLSEELDVSPLIAAARAAGKGVVLPKFLPATGSYSAFQINDLARDCAGGKFGIQEPSDGCPSWPLNQLDLVLVPGVGFDVAGHRLGRGKGFYDRLLAGVSGIKCGVAFDAQVIDAIPFEPHDVAVDCILTPTRWLEVSGRRPV